MESRRDQDENVLEEARLTPEALAAVDRWRAERAQSMSPPGQMDRAEALGRLVAEALTGMGLLKP